LNALGKMYIEQIKSVYKPLGKQVLVPYSQAAPEEKQRQYGNFVDSSLLLIALGLVSLESLADWGYAPELAGLAKAITTASAEESASGSGSCGGGCGG
jgi:hypothetical protein